MIGILDEQCWERKEYAVDAHGAAKLLTDLSRKLPFTEIPKERAPFGFGRRLYDFACE